MKRARIIVLGIALTAALGAAWMAKRMISGTEVREVEKTVGAVDVLVAVSVGVSVGVFVAVLVGVCVGVLVGVGVAFVPNNAS